MWKQKETRQSMNVIWCREDRCNVARGLRVPFFFSLTFELVGKHLQEEPPLLLSFTLLRIKYQTLTSAATATLCMLLRCSLPCAPSCRNINSHGNLIGAFHSKSDLKTQNRSFKCDFRETELPLRPAEGSAFI